MLLIKTTDLNNWADSRAAQDQLPYYLKKLICAVIQPHYLRMPSGDAVWIPGFDGEVINLDKENRFVPWGRSVWEVGVGPDYKDKANKDYVKRSRDVADGKKKEKTIDRSEVTFVFATPRIWQDKKDWVAERESEGIWKGIVVIDGVDLQDWLEDAPGVALPLAADMRLVSEAGLQYLDQAWDEWSRLTDPPISEELIVAGREDQEKNFTDRLVGSPSTFTVRGASPREAWGFTLAVLRRFNSKDKNLSLDARIIVADDEIIAEKLRHFNNLIIVLKQTRDQVSGALSSGVRHVIIPEGNDIHSVRNVIELVRPTHNQFVDALGGMGLSGDDAERTARECGLSVTILQRRRAQANFRRPPWSDGELAIYLLPAVLAGRWNNQNEADREILRQLAGAEDYDSVERQLFQFLSVDEPPLRKINEMWTLTAPADAFQLTARHLAPANLDRFKIAFQDVFGKIDPRVEISPDEWLYFGIKGEKGHSSWLRSGLAETLLLIAERGTGAQLVCVTSPRVYADDVVSGLPGLNNDWRVLGSIRDQYARLMEAAPSPLLDSLERMLEAKPDDVRRLFAEGNEPFGGGAMHTGLLWGLETMAWSPDYLPRVALILSELARIDPGGRLLNRPINSLREIFLWWNPNTNATIEQRLHAIDLILARESDVGWDLLAKLLPELHSISTKTAKPRWRDFGDLAEDARTRQGQIQYMSAIADRALALVGSDPDRWRVILNSLRGLKASHREKAVNLLNIIAEGLAPNDLKAKLWEILREFTYQHRTYREAAWALPGELLDQLDTIIPHLAPIDPIEQSRWLFNEWLPVLPDGEEDVDRRQEKVLLLRQKAVDEILHLQGIEGLVELGTTCRFPGVVAFAAMPLIANLDDLRTFVQQAISAGKEGVILASHISAQAQQLHGEAWRNLIRQEIKAGTWPSIVAASLIIWWPNEMATWEDAISLGIAMEYWQQKQVAIIKGSPEEQVYQIDHLAAAGRATQTLLHVANWMESVPTAALVRLFDAAMKEIAQAKTADDIQKLGLSAFDLERFLAQLHGRTDLPKEELARREYQALPLLALSDVQGLTLHEFMAEDPNFFVEVLCEAFLPAHRDKSVDVKPTAEMKARGSAAYSLLNGMVFIPGQNGNDFEGDLQKWVDSVRKKASEVDRVVIADQQIGQILAHSQNDPEDKGWPHRAVRNLIENLKNDSIDLGLKIGRFNMRGVVSRNPYEGGVQERILVNQYHSWAEISQAKWPRMAHVLETMAQEWELEAQREDVRAEQEKSD